MPCLLIVFGLYRCCPAPGPRAIQRSAVEWCYQHRRRPAGSGAGPCWRLAGTLPTDQCPKQAGSIASRPQITSAIHSSTHGLANDAYRSSGRSPALQWLPLPSSNAGIASRSGHRAAGPGPGLPGSSGTTRRQRRGRAVPPAGAADARAAAGTARARVQPPGARVHEAAHRRLWGSAQRQQARLLPARAAHRWVGRQWAQLEWHCECCTCGFHAPRC